MANNLFFDTLPSTVKSADVNFEQSVETEILLADYDAPVFKIVKTTLEHLVTQKYIMQSKLTVEGFIKVNICYQSPESRKLHTVSQKIPFQKQIEVGQHTADYIDVQGNCQYVNTRPQNPTRIDVRGVYMFNIRVYSAQETQVITAVASDSVCCDTAQLDCFSMTVQNTRQFSTEQPLSMPENMHKILRVSTSAPIPAVAVYTDKITVKGEINADVYYTLSDSDDVHTHSQSFAYNQIVDMPQIQDNNVPYTQVAVTSFGISQNSEDKKLNATLTVQIDALAFAKQQIIAVRDGFSRRYEYEKESRQQLVDTNMHILNKAVTLQFSDAVAGGYKICDVQFEITPAKSYYEINKTTVKSKIFAHIIALNGQNEYECITKSEDIVFDWLEKCGRYDEICLDLSVSGYSCSENSVTVNICAKGFVIEKQPVELLGSFEEYCDKPQENISEALVILYGKKGERVFDIAKNHNVSPQIIMEENMLDNDRLPEDTMLVIPAFEW
ncbi:MAG: DUF3794 domain-containing protein [Oscillospiraceae bacterium]|nr:DUF3794 domain-containing protein [Oscillospiraceae bacterium]